MNKLESIELVYFFYIRWDLSWLKIRNNLLKIGWMIINLNAVRNWVILLELKIWIYQSEFMKKLIVKKNYCNVICKRARWIKLCNFKINKVWKLIMLLCLDLWFLVILKVLWILLLKFANKILQLMFIILLKFSYKIIDLLN